MTVLNTFVSPIIKYIEIEGLIQLASRIGLMVNEIYMLATSAEATELHSGNERNVQRLNE